MHACDALPACAGGVLVAVSDGSRFRVQPITEPPRADEDQQAHAGGDPLIAERAHGPEPERPERQPGEQRIPEAFPRPHLDEHEE